MGVFYDGGMIVGSHYNDINVPEKYDGDLWEFIEDNGMTTLSPYYDSGYNILIGFNVDNILVSEMTSEWLSKIRELAHEFEEIAGCPAKLIGAQNIT